MANFKGIGNGGIWSYSGRQQPHLPPKSPFPSVTPGFVDYGSSHATTSRGIPKPQEGQKHHQRTSSESCLIDEQPSWLDDLLNEPETPVKRGGHRRSSSDSFAYLEVPSSFPDVDNVSQSESLYGNISSMTLRGPLDFQRAKDDYHASFYSDANSFGVQTVNRRWNSTPNSIRPVSHKSAKNNAKSVSLTSPSTQKDGPSATAEKQSVQDSAPHDQKGSLEKVEGSHAKQSSADVDQKRVKQQFAQRSRVRKLQYIAELERNVQALQAEESEVSAELAFLDRQHLILSLENKALRQRLESIGQEQLVKYLEQEMLEKEVQRLKMLLCQQQRCYDQQASATTSRDLSSQFTALSLSRGQRSSNRDSLSGPLRI
ncbi:uncharacterized protein At4g06598-like isoform X2 [Nymphaea colorata]|uniref:uncharacterized protein At4g06598-like isoform X2 n=1 Tax=Nymphaea colorata TaxID=210225 RepID=UPI00129ED3D1|nr:uncharacterized protein At4g06598-like isoform X2 [Nymphaea colorata]